MQALNESVKGADVQAGSLKTAIMRLKNIAGKSKSTVADPLSVAVANSLKASRSEFEKMSQEDQDKLVALTQIQRDAIKVLDKSTKDAYLKRRVEIHDEAIEDNEL